MFLFLLTCVVTFIKMATKTNNNHLCIDKKQTTTFYYPTQIPHFVGYAKKTRKNRRVDENKNLSQELNSSYVVASKITEENLKMQNYENYKSAKENRHLRDNYILHRYLNSKYQQEKVFKSIRGMSNNYQQNQQSNNNLVLNKLSSLVSPHHHHHSSANSSPQKKNSLLLCSNNKRPLSSTNVNATQDQHSSPRKTLLNGNLIAKAKTILAEKPQLLIDNYELNDESLRNNVQIVLQNINQNLQQSQPSNAAISLNDLHFLSSDSFLNMSSSPESDCNSNPQPPPVAYLQPSSLTAIDCSVASSQDFTHDNLDYQWCPDYGYRDPMMMTQQHQSVLSSLFSYSGIGELSYYEDLAKNIDANLAEVDMESFRAEDIHSLLTNLPTICSQQSGGADNDILRQKMSLHDLDNSICKSELLFSPVKESHISVDSLDMSGYPEDENIILTCKANKDNYTIAFEGSAMYSDDSFYDGPEYSNAIKMKQNTVNLNNFNNKLLNTPAMNNSMSKSETGYTTWSKLRQSNTALESRESQDDITDDHHHESMPMHPIRHLPHCYVNKSSSMPNLKTILSNQLQISDAISNSTVDSYGHQRAMLPHYPMPISTTSDIDSPNVEKMHESVAENDIIGSGSAQNAPSFNLVKLFIKQKSSSTDTCMDVSSGCWPSDSSSSDNANNNGSSNSGSRMRKRSMNDSGKGSALSRHDEEVPREEEEFQYDSLDCAAVNSAAVLEEQRRVNTAVSSPMKVPKQGTNYKDLHLNIRHQLKHPALYNLMQPHHQKPLNNSINNNNNSHSDTSHTSENLTQIFNINKSRTIDMMTKSIQTSMIKEATSNNIRIIPPSFLAKLNQEIRNRNKERASVFVVYPNYALPDLGFVSTAPNELILSPVGFKDSFAKMKSRRPMSLNDVDAMKSRQYGHVIDWKSLMTLLPTEYRKILKNIPEANEVSMEASVLSNKPLFSMTPPIRTSRAVSCDCAYILSNTQVTSSSSGGSSSQPPSSGYRGSSTILTDSDMNEQIGSNNMYVYQYEEPPKERPPTGKTPRGILRRANTARSAQKSKRSSMFEGGEYTMTHAEKRRSLQEPFYATQIIEDYIAEMESAENRHVAKRNLLPNYPKQREEYQDHRQSKMQGIDDIDLMQPPRQRRNSVIDQANEFEARIRAEQFLINVPKSDLKHYAEIANILEAVPEPPLNSIHLRNEVSRALSSQQQQQQHQIQQNNRKQVQFTKPTAGQPSPKVTSPMKQRSPMNPRLLKPNELRFSTPPNSPNMSVMTGKKQSPTSQRQKDAEKEKQEKIQSNRFKRLQIQWELLSKDAAQRAMETKSGGTTPLSAPKSRIPRPVSYPAATRTESKPGVPKSPTRMITPKKYNIPKVSPTTANAPTPRTPSRTAPSNTTPKKTVTRPSSVRTR